MARSFTQHLQFRKQMLILLLDMYRRQARNDLFHAVFLFENVSSIQQNAA